MKTRFLLTALFLGAVHSAAFAQTNPSSPGLFPTTDAASADGRPRRGNFNPADLQARMLANLREQLAVKDDAEWALIAERITAVNNFRRSLAVVGGFGGRGGGGAGGGNTWGNRPGAVANPEMDALRAALADNLPDTEIAARLGRVREVRKQNEAKLTQAHDELRAVLTPRQEAVAVTAGLLD